MHDGLMAEDFVVSSTGKVGEQLSSQHRPADGNHASLSFYLFLLTIEVDRLGRGPVTAPRLRA